ncbi:MFS transporter [Pendulispora albinea]|uniref:MFS transporter n=1 Tax=Pendulispora albinea TaxID=2741071 RepID=A0ABZ2LQP3_9BACT
MTTASPPRSILQSWLAVASVAVGTFAMVTTEFLPVGLLTDIASNLGISDGTAGLMVTTPGLVGAIGSPILIVAAGRLDRRTALWALTIMLIASNAIAALAPNFPVLLLGRMLLGLCVGGFWTLASALGRRLVPEESGGRATAVISAGVSVGTVCGVPAANFIGNLAGWRVAFAATAVLAGLVLIAQLLLLPKLPTKQAIGARELFALWRVPAARVGLLSVSLVAAGQFAAYTYLKPFLEQVTKMGTDAITGVLLAYGLAGFIGTFLAEWGAARNLKATYVATALLLSIVMLLAPVLGAGKASATVLAMVWGLAFGSIPVSVQIWMYQSAPEQFEGGSAWLVSTFQISIALGSFGGGVAVDRVGVWGAMVMGGILSLGAAFIIAALGRARSAAPLDAAPAVTPELVE